MDAGFEQTMLDTGVLSKSSVVAARADGRRASSLRAVWSRHDSPRISTRWQCWAKRSTSATTHAAPGNVLPHCLNARFVVMIVERCFVAAADDVVQDVGGAGVVREIPKLVEDKHIGVRVAPEPALEGGHRFLARADRQARRRGSRTGR
jgi:hypothetical protein